MIAADQAQVIAVATGGVVGLLLALTGAGGGILAVPLLVFGLHLAISQAAPIGLMAVGLASLVGAVAGLIARRVRYRAAALIGGTGMLFSPLGVWLSQQVPNGPLTLFFAVVLAGVAVRMYLRTLDRPGTGAPGPDRAPPCVRNPADGRFIWSRPCARALTITGCLAGALSGLLGVGGGFVIVPSLTRYTDLDPRSVVATSLAVIALVSIGGVGAATLHGVVVWHVAVPFASGAMGALLLGRTIADRVAGKHLHRTFAVVSGVVAMLMLARALLG